MMRVHPKWKVVGKGRDRRRVKIEWFDCESCKQKCQTCRLPYTTSTAMQEKLFCSLHCEGRNNMSH